MTGVDRRQFLRLSAATAATLAVGPGCGDDVAPYVEPGGWSAGDVAHLLPVAGPDRIRLKVSFRSSRSAILLQTSDGRTVEATPSDSDGRFFAFDLRRLEPGREYTFALYDGAGNALCDPWPLRTLPAPDVLPERFRLLVYTCAGGPEIFRDLRLRPAFLPLEVRRRLLARALSFQPDAALANGDHVYWDLHSRFGIGMGRSPQAWWSAGFFDREAPLLGGANEQVLKAAFGPQIADLYGTLFRSVPTFFLQDDHDYSENDEANDELRTFPADAFMEGVARATQRLYYPELLPDASLPRSLVARGDLAESFGSLRYGRLFEALLYDCRRFLTNAADPALGHAESLFVPPAAERWLLERTRASDVVHQLHAPSTPVLWTAGKWGEWYPDVQDDDGALSVDVPKPYWPEGWLRQHDRLLAAASAQRARTPLFVSGDLHAIGVGRIQRSGELDLSANPVVSVLPGPIGTGNAGWPSNFRGQPARPSRMLDAEEWTAPIEQNGFALLDVDREHVKLRLFGWHPDQGIDAIATLEPFASYELLRDG